MPRKGHISKREVAPDPVYSSTLVTKFVNSMMWGGKKSTAQNIFYESMKNRMLEEMKKLFRPEFLNRVDEVIVFHHLKREEILQIAELYLRRVNEQAKSMEITIELSDAVKDKLVSEGYDPNLGARPLRRAVQRFIEDPLSEEMLLGRFHAGDEIVADLEDGTVVFKNKKSLQPKKKEKELVSK